MESSWQFKKRLPLGEAEQASLSLNNNKFNKNKKIKTKKEKLGKLKIIYTNADQLTLRNSSFWTISSRNIRTLWQSLK